MKTAVVFFRDVKESFKGDYYFSLLSEFEKAAVEVGVTEILSVTDDIKFSKDFSYKEKTSQVPASDLQKKTHKAEPDGEDLHQHLQKSRPMGPVLSCPTALRLNNYSICPEG